MLGDARINVVADPFGLSEQDVVVWAVHREAATTTVEEFRKFLTPDELIRASRFRSQHLQRSFIVRRGALRLLLGRYSDTDPAQIRFRYGPNGKPAIDAPSRIWFNTSHSANLALCAFALDREIGVDVEQIRPLPDMEEIAKRFFSEEETSALLSLASNQRERAFFLCWTRKEAYVKATGSGLSTPLDQFAVTLGPGEPARLVHLSGDSNAASAWTLHNLEVDPAYAAAAAYRGAPRSLRVMPFTEPAALLEPDAPWRKLDPG